jgi:hypothetical protein
MMKKVAITLSPLLLSFFACIANAQPLAFVSNEGSGTVSVIDLTKMKSLTLLKLLVSQEVFMQLLTRILFMFPN